MGSMYLCHFFVGAVFCHGDINAWVFFFFIIIEFRHCIISKVISSFII